MQGAANQKKAGLAGGGWQIKLPGCAPRPLLKINIDYFKCDLYKASPLVSTRFIKTAEMGIKHYLKMFSDLFRCLKLTLLDVLKVK